jgi:hypothetical protein
VSNRNRNEPENRNNNIGVRCVGDVGPLPRERMAGAVRIEVRAGEPRPLPGFGPGEPPQAERRIQTARSGLW